MAGLCPDVCSLAFKALLTRPSLSDRSCSLHALVSPCVDAAVAQSGVPIEAYLFPSPGVLLLFRCPVRGLSSADAALDACR